MTEEWSTVSDRKNLKTIAILLIAILCISSVTVIALSADNTELKPVEKQKYTTSYTSITAEKAKNLTDTNINLIITDIRGCRCNWEEGHIPTAIWQTYAPNLKNTAQDILVYCQNGNESISFCEELVGNVYGAIYHLEGGFEAWKKAGYPFDKAE